MERQTMNETRMAPAKRNRTGARIPHKVRHCLLPLIGFISLLWFLIRVLPKPQRATYPCQRIAFPMASSFVIWVTGLFCSAFLFRQVRPLLLLRGRRRAALALLLAGAVAALTMAVMPKHEGFALTVIPNAPIGTARGIHPGRVVWAHNPDATSWAGFDSTEHWYEPEHTDMDVVESMMERTLLTLTGEPNATAAWDALFRYSNQQQGKGDIGYQPGENITIKLNLVTSKGADVVNTNTYEKLPTLLNRVDVAPQMVISLLRQLVLVAGVPQTNIFIGDPTSLVPNHFWNAWTAVFPDVNYLDNLGNLGRTRVEFSDTPFYWSTPDAAGKLQDYLPVSYAQADYLINFAVLKGHARGGVTLCAKNHYGSLLRTPIGDVRDQKGLDYYGLHESLPSESPGTGHYRALVDLMGHPRIGGATMLYLIDGLYGGDDWDCHPYIWTSPGFGDGVHGDWPSSLFASQDPVAIDSVAFDFLLAEWPDVVGKGSLEGGAQDYLIEAALAGNPPSGTFYDPDNDGIRLSSLGVHEHWNNPYEKKYSRNLGTGAGIELVSIDDGALRIASGQHTPSSIQLSLTNLLPGSSYTILSATALTDTAWTPTATITADAVASNWQSAIGDTWERTFFKIKQVAAAHNLIFNPGFEDIGATNTAALGWEDNVQGGMWGSAKRAGWRWQSGDQAAVIVGDGTTYGGWWQAFPVDADTTCQCAAYFYKESGWYASEVIMKVEWYNASGQQIDAATHSLLDLPVDTWTHRSIQVTAPVQAASAHFVLQVSGMGPGHSLYMDALYFGK
ncbi:MAG: DUF362 domain-containing protein [Spartobacteria bacterium]|nr:DUF362 domain-containing protein [Spartobacteria bacterium]